MPSNYTKMTGSRTRFHVQLKFSSIFLKEFFFSSQTKTSLCAFSSWTGMCVQNIAVVCTVHIVLVQKLLNIEIACNQLFKSVVHSLSSVVRIHFNLHHRRLSSGDAVELLLVHHLLEHAILRYATEYLNSACEHTQCTNWNILSRRIWAKSYCGSDACFSCSWNKHIVMFDCRMETIQLNVSQFSWCTWKSQLRSRTLICQHIDLVWFESVVCTLYNDISNIDASAFDTLTDTVAIAM